MYTLHETKLHQSLLTIFLNYSLQVINAQRLQGLLLRQSHLMWIQHRRIHHCVVYQFQCLQVTVQTVTDQNRSRMEHRQ